MHTVPTTGTPIEADACPTVRRGAPRWLAPHGPWNQRFACVLLEDSPFVPCKFLREQVARTLAHHLLELPQEEFSAAFRKSGTASNRKTFLA